jgi:hypothetical protein
LSSTPFSWRKDSAMKSEPSSATQKETGSWTSGSWAKMAQESGATGAIEGGAGADCAFGSAATTTDVEAGGSGDWVKSIAATSGIVGSGGIMGVHPNTEVDVRTGDSRVTVEGIHPRRYPKLSREIPATSESGSTRGMSQSHVSATSIRSLWLLIFGDSARERATESCPRQQLDSTVGGTKSWSLPTRSPCETIHRIARIR